MTLQSLVKVIRPVAAVAAVAVSSLKWTAVSLAATPSPRPVQVDPRGGGAPPGFAAGPLEVLLLVALLGVVAAVMTVVVVRLTGTGGET